MSDSPLVGFCPSCADDIAIDADGRCLTHGTRTLAPSTGCNHQRWQPTEGAWSRCIPVDGEIQRRVCKPVSPGTWRTTLDGKRTAPTPVESEQSQQARRFGGSPNAVPKPTTAHKPALPDQPCHQCGEPFRPRRTRSVYCSVDCARRGSFRNQGHKMLAPCPGCGADFYPKPGGDGTRQRHCSRACATQRQKARAS